MNSDSPSSFLFSLHSVRKPTVLSFHCAPGNLETPFEWQAGSLLANVRQQPVTGNEIRRDQRMSVFVVMEDRFFIKSGLDLNGLSSAHLFFFHSYTMLLQLNSAFKLVSLTLAALLFTAVSAAPIANVDVNPSDCVKVNIPSLKSSGDRRFVLASNNLSVKIDVSNCDPSVVNRQGPVKITLVDLKQGDSTEVNVVGGSLLISIQSLVIQSHLLTAQLFFRDQHS